MSFLLFSLPAAVIPALILVVYFVRSDKYPEPFSMLLKTFLYGVFIVIPVLIMGGVFEFLGELLNVKEDVLSSALFDAFPLAAIPEELFKFWVLSAICAKSSEFDEPMDGIVYGAVASLGFATLENIMYVSGGGLGVALVRAFTAVPAHAAFGAIMGYYFSKVYFQGGRVSLTSRAYFVPMMLHGLYDFSLFYMVGISNQYEHTENMSDGEAFLVLGSMIMFFVVFVHTIRRANRYLKEMRQEQEAKSHLVHTEHFKCVEKQNPVR